MASQLRRKPNDKQYFGERLRISLPGNHAPKQKIAMLLMGKFDLQHLHNLDIPLLGPCDFYASVLDQNGYPLTRFPDGREIHEFEMIVNHPYPCAADEYDRIFRTLAPRAF